MAEQTGTERPQLETGQVPQRRPHGRRVLMGGLGVTAGLAGLTSAVGGAVMILAAAALGVAAVLGVVVWRLPHLRRHFANPNPRRPRAARERRLRTRTQRTAGRMPRMPRPSRSGGVLGRRSRAGSSTGQRRARAGTGRTSRSAAGSTRRRAGGFASPAPARARSRRASSSRGTGSARGRGRGSSGQGRGLTPRQGRRLARTGSPFSRREARRQARTGSPFTRRRQRRAAAARSARRMTRPASSSRPAPGSRRAARPAGTGRLSRRQASRQARTGSPWTRRQQARIGRTGSPHTRRQQSRQARRAARRILPRRPWRQPVPVPAGPSGPGRPGWRTRRAVRRRTRQLRKARMRRQAGPAGLRRRRSWRVNPLRRWRERRPPRAWQHRAPRRLRPAARRWDRWRTASWRRRHPLRRGGSRAPLPADRRPVVTIHRPARQPARAEPGTPSDPAGEQRRRLHTETWRRENPVSPPLMKGHQTMATSETTALQEAFQTHLAPFDPGGRGGLATADLLGDLPGVYDAFGQALRTVADRMGDGPYAQAAQEVLHELAAATAGLRDKAAESAAQFERSHEPELKRLRNPRPQEAAWNV